MENMLQTLLILVGFLLNLIFIITIIPFLIFLFMWKFPIFLTCCASYYAAFLLWSVLPFSRTIN